MELKVTHPALAGHVIRWSGNVVACQAGLRNLPGGAYGAYMITAEELMVPVVMDIAVEEVYTCLRTLPSSQIRRFIAEVLTPLRNNNPLTH